MTSRAAAAPVILAGCAIALGLLVMVGWHARIPLLTQIHAAHTPMVYNTALCFVFCGVATILLQIRHWRAGFALGAIVLILAALNGFEIVTGANLAIDNIFIDHYINTRSQSAGQMAPNTVVCFLLLGSAIITIAVATRKRWCRQVAALLTGIAIALACWALAGFVQGVTSAYEWGGMTPMALHTPIGFLFIGASLMTLLWNRQWAATSNSFVNQRDLGIDVKISIVISVLVLASSGFVAMWCYEHFNRALVDERLRELTFDARSVGLQFQALMDTATRDAKIRASSPEVQSFVNAQIESSQSEDRATAEQWKQDIQRRFEQLLAVNPDYLQLRIIGIDDGGRELIRSERRGGAIFSVADEALQQKGGEPYFDESVRLREGETHISRINLNREFGKIETPHRPVIRVSAPIYAESRGIFGFIIINIDLASFFAEVRNNLPEHRELYIANGDGEFLLHPDPSRCFRFEFGESDRLQNQFTSLEAMARDADLASMRFSQQTDGGDTVAVGVSRATFGPEDQPSSLMIATTAPFAEIAAATKRLRTRAMFISFALVIISTLVATVLAQTLTRPLRQMTRSVQALTKGETDLQLPIHARNEVGELARAFAETLDKLRITDKALLRESERQRLLSGAVESSLDAIIIVDLQGHVIEWNAAAEELYKYTAEEARGRHIYFLIPEDRQEEFTRLLQGVKAGESFLIAETTRRSKDGQLIDVSVTAAPVVDKSGEIIGIAKIERDLTERKRVDAQFRMAVESAPNGIIMVDQQGKIILVNCETEELFGYERDEIIGQPIEVLVPERFRDSHPSQRDAYMRIPERRGMGAGRELFGRRKDGSEFPVEIGLNPIRTREGVLVLSTVVDVTLRKEHENHIQKYTAELENKNEELQQFAYIASHDLQEPLRKIQAFGNMLQSSFSQSLGDEGKEYIDRMQSSAHRMRCLIDDLLSYSRVSTVTRAFEFVDLNRVVKEVLSDLEVRIEETDGTINVCDLPTVQGDESQMRQLFQNLLGNALKFHREDVAPVVHVECKEAAGGRCTIIVRDNGIGFDEKYNDRIFAPFQRLHGRSKYEGTGIGLAVCRKIVDRHHGSITATSAPGKGATFSITLPLTVHRQGDLRHAA